MSARRPCQRLDYQQRKISCAAPSVVAALSSQSTNCDCRVHSVEGIGSSFAFSLPVSVMWRGSRPPNSDPDDVAARAVPATVRSDSLFVRSKPWLNAEPRSVSKTLNLVDALPEDMMGWRLVQKMPLTLAEERAALGLRLNEKPHRESERPGSGHGLPPQLDATVHTAAAAGAAAVPPRERASAGLDLVFKGGGMVLSNVRPLHSEMHGYPMILSVDNEPLNQLVIRNLLIPKHYSLVEADSGQTALEYLETCKAR